MLKHAVFLTRGVVRFGIPIQRLEIRGRAFVGCISGMAM
jgi:hypothetical protein